MIGEIRQNLNCLEFGYLEDKGRILLRDLFLPKNGTLYTITVGTKETLDQIRKENELFPDPAMKRDENIFVMEDISDFDVVCQGLINSPFEALQPFLREQVIEEAAS